MIKILSVDQIKQLDARTIAHEPIASIDLMERASHSFVNWFMQRFDNTKKVGIVCGTGNNGGDGLAIARMLNDWHYKVSVWIVRGSIKETNDFLINRQRLSYKLAAIDITSPSNQNLFTDQDVLIDAIIGSGLSRPTKDVYEQVINWMNSCEAIRIAIDVPSGLYAEQHSRGAVVKAHYTVSFQLPKLAFLLPENFEFVGDWYAVKICLDKKGIEEAETNHFVVEHNDIRSIIKPRNKFDHKGVYGKALLIAGCHGKMGAAVLSAKAIMRSGVGLLTTHVPSCGYEILQTAVPESMVSVDIEENHFSQVPELSDFDAIGVGPGLGQSPKSKKALQDLLQKYKKPLVLDADALNILASDKALTKLISANSILTPHPGEFGRLVGVWKNDFERLELQKRLAKNTNSIIILKGAHTSIVSPDGKVYFNTTGNPGMATAGSGDVLTGILTGLLAQGYSPLKAAQLGVYLHGLAGDLAAKSLSQQAFIASDIIDYLPMAYREMQ
jgi:ADP-dependent NAD(P)H-hydrate dehydratase / NAD(P)H-hydrate epimerase